MPRTGGPLKVETGAVGAVAAAAGEDGRGGGGGGAGRWALWRRRRRKTVVGVAVVRRRAKPAGRSTARYWRVGVPPVGNSSVPTARRDRRPHSCARRAGVTPRAQPRSTRIG